jgi:cell division transport system permease protein
MKRWLRHHHYAFMMAVRRLSSQPFSSLSNMLVISMTLAIPILAASILISAQPVARQIAVSPEVTLFLKPDAPAGTAQQIVKRLQANHTTQIQSVRIMPRDQAYNELKKDPSWATALAAVPGNPLPDAVVVTLNQQTDLTHSASALVHEWQTWNEVDLVQHDSAWVQRLEAILSFLRVGLGMLAAVVALAALALLPLNSALARLASSYGTQLALQLPDALSLTLAVIVVAILAALAARWSVTRNTRF